MTKDLVQAIGPEFTQGLRIKLHLNCWHRA
jgi:hypothetical protein